MIWSLITLLLSKYFLINELLMIEIIIFKIFYLLHSLNLYNMKQHIYVKKQFLLLEGFYLKFSYIYVNAHNPCFFIINLQKL